ncbi:MAG: AraC family transcriptional regulator [Ruminococcaceae bacterium]|nr:AraC family transcriptional regulator [Oscillospiraceae bacterium]
MERISYHYQHDLPLRNRHFVDLNPLEVGAEQTSPGFSVGPYTRQHYLIHYILSGKGRFLINGTKYTVKAGEFFLIRPDDITRYVADEEDPWHYVWVGFDGTLAQKFNTMPLVNKMAPGLWMEIRQALLQEFAGWEGMKEEYIVMMLHRIMAELFAERSSSKTEAHYASRVRTYIQTSYAQNITVQGIADMFSLDRRYLTRLFKNRYGLTIQEYLLKMRLENAARLLLAGHSVSESAALSGYRERSHFSRMFHQHFGEWPQEYAQNRK